MLVAGVAIFEFVVRERGFPAPNVVWIVLDTVRADHVSFAGQASRPTTPFLDTLAKEGVVFTHARAPSNWTLPSHASMFTGLSPGEHGCHFEHRWLSDEVLTIAEVLQVGSISYSTAAFSSNVNVSGTFNLDQGFDHFYETWNDATVEPGSASSEVVCRRVLEWIDAQRRRPAFLFLNLMDAHLPYEAAPGAADHFGRAKIDPKLLAAPDLFDRVLAGEVRIDDETRRQLELRYDNAIVGLDRAIASLIQGLRARDHFDDTIFIVTSDHGENLGDHGLVDHQGSLHESVLRVPLLIVGPGVPAGVRIDRPVSTTDLFDWVQDLVRGGFKPDALGRKEIVVSERMRPVDVLERLARRRPPVDPGDVALRSFAAVTDAEPFKLLRRETKEDALVALPASPRGDEPDVTGARREELAALRALLDDELRQRRVVREKLVAERGPASATDEAIAQLKAQGYVSGGVSPGVSVHAQEHLSRGNRAYQAEDLVAARREYDAAVKLAPEFADAHFNRALVIDRLAPNEAKDAWRSYVDVAHRVGGQSDASIQHALSRIGELP